MAERPVALPPATQQGSADADDFVKNAIARKIIDLGKAGERNPDLLANGIEGHSPAGSVAARVLVPLTVY